MRRLKYLQMGIFNWFAKAVVDTGWSLRRAEAVSARIRVYRFGSGDKVVCLWFVELLSGRIKKTGWRSIGKKSVGAEGNWSYIRFYPLAELSQCMLDPADGLVVL